MRIDIHPALVAKLTQLAELQGCHADELVDQLLEKAINTALEDYPNDFDFEDWLVENAA